MADARQVSLFTGTSKRGLESFIQEDGSLAFVIVVPHPRTCHRACFRCTYRMHHTFLHSLWPASPLLLFTTCVGTLALVLKTESTAGIRNGWLAHFLWDLSTYVPGVESHSVSFRVGYLTCIAAFVLFFGISYVLRLALRIIFSWQGWLYRGASSRCCTKCWALSVRVLEGRDCFPSKAMTYSYQGALPSLPVPNLQSTVTKYIASVKPLLSEEEFLATEVLASEFMTGIGPNLNRYLTLKSWLWTSNYITDWWEKYVYLRGRSSLMINSNYYIMDFENVVPTPRQTARAAAITRLMCDFCRLLDQEKIEPMRVRGLAPLCMAQYERMFATTRQPGRDADVLYHRSRARHVVVLCAGHWYRVDVVRIPSGVPVAAAELERQFNAIQNDADRLNRNMSSRGNGERGRGTTDNNSGTDSLSALGGGGGGGSSGSGSSSSSSSMGGGGGGGGMRRSHSMPMGMGKAMRQDRSNNGLYERLSGRQISALTALPRDEWAKAKEEFLSEGVNRISLREIERALFVVVLDQDKHATLSERGKSLLHGNGTNRWFDKSLQLIVYRDGHCGMNCEHSWADAPVSGHLWEYCLCHEVAGNSVYAGDGHVRGYKHGGKRRGGEGRRGSGGSGGRGGSGRGRSSSGGGTDHDQNHYDVSSYKSWKTKESTTTATTETTTVGENKEDITTSKSVRKKFSQPQRLRFELTSTASTVVRNATASAKKSISDLDLHVFGYEVYGKREIKQFQISPDAFLQMALQLAYFRDSEGTLALTYEASMVRLFKQGRTETVRSLTKESSLFVKAMCSNIDGGNIDQRKVQLQSLLRKACDRHQNSYIDAMKGQGIDRHLFALVSR